MYTQQQPMSGLASLMALQGRGGDTTLVHMNPMEVRRLAALSPDGTLSVNPETGLPEAFKLKDIAALALPIIGSIALPALAPGLLGTYGTAALGAGLGGTAAGLVQGRGLGESLIQGGISGLLSYGMGSALGPDVPDVTAATMPKGSQALAATAPSPTTTGPVPQYAPVDPKAEWLDKQAYSAFTTPVAPQTLGTTNLGANAPTYGQAASAGLSGMMAPGLGQDLGLMSPDFIMQPFELAQDEYNPDMAGLTAAGRARARRLQQPPSYASSADLARLAYGPTGYGTFLAADGGSVPSLFRFADGGDVGGEESGYGGDVGLSNAEGDVSSGMGLGGYSDAQAEAVTQGLAEMGIGFGGDPTGVYGSVDPQELENYANAQNTAEGLTGFLVNNLTPFNISANPMTMGLNVGLSMPSVFGTALGVPGLGLVGKMMDIPDVPLTPEVPGKSISEPPTDVNTMDSGDGDPWIRPYGDPYNTSKPVVSEPTPTEPNSFFRRQVRTPLTLADIVGYTTGQSGYQGGFPRFLPPVVAAQGGGISALAYGGDTAPTGYGNPAFEGMVPGTGTGMSDSVPFSIEGQQPALLSRDEYVLPADVVSQLGDGSSGAGADMLNNFVSQVRQSKYGNTQQPPANGTGLMGALMRHGGIV